MLEQASRSEFAVCAATLMLDDIDWRRTGCNARSKFLMIMKTTPQAKWVGTRDLHGTMVSALRWFTSTPCESRRCFRGTRIWRPALVSWKYPRRVFLQKRVGSVVAWNGKWLRFDNPCHRAKSQLPKSSADPRLTSRTACRCPSFLILGSSTTLCKYEGAAHSHANDESCFATHRRCRAWQSVSSARPQGSRASDGQRCEFRTKTTHVNSTNRGPGRAFRTEQLC